MIQHIIENKIVYLLTWDFPFGWLNLQVDGNNNFLPLFLDKKGLRCNKEHTLLLTSPITFSTHRPNFKRVCYLNLKGIQFLPQKLNVYRNNHYDKSSSYSFSPHCFYVFAPNKYSMRHMEFMRTVMSRLVISESYFSPSFHTDGALCTCAGKYRNAGLFVGFHFFCN